MHRNIAVIGKSLLIQQHPVVINNSSFYGKLIKTGFNRQINVTHRKLHSGASFQLQNSTMSYSQNQRTEQLQLPAQLAVKVFGAAVESVKPKNLLHEKLKLQGSTLSVQDFEGKWSDFSLNKYKSLYVIGFGKAVLPMAESVVEILRATKKMAKCIVNVPVGFRDSSVSEIVVQRGAADNIPDEAAFQATKNIVDVIKSCDPNDLVIVLISGGGSALFTYPTPPITVSELASLVKAMSRSGATIQELNCVRKRLSLVKGGGLLKLCGANNIIGLILSDVLGDPIDIIASGPTVKNSDPDALAQTVISKYIALDQLPRSIQQVLAVPPSQPPIYKEVFNSIIGNNTLALNQAAQESRNLNLLPLLLTNKLSGEARFVGEKLAVFAELLVNLLEKLSRKTEDAAKCADDVRNSLMGLSIDPLDIDTFMAKVKVLPGIPEGVQGISVLLGGETTVRVQGSGIGGRNQELALSAAKILHAHSNSPVLKGKVAVLSAGTDGFDGPCNAAGAVVDTSTIAKGENSKLSPAEYLKNNNSYHYFEKNSSGMYHIVTGHTETNVMDIVVIVVLKSSAIPKL